MRDPLPSCVDTHDHTVLRHHSRAWCGLSAFFRPPSAYRAGRMGEDSLQGGLTTRSDPIAVAHHELDSVRAPPGSPPPGTGPRPRRPPRRTPRRVVAAVRAYVPRPAPLPSAAPRALRV